MNEPLFITILLSLVATFFALLVLVAGWLGNKLYAKLSEMAATMQMIKTELHAHIFNLDIRVTVLETKLGKDRRNTNSCLD
jgi:cell division protein FtsB